MRKYVPKSGEFVLLKKFPYNDLKNVAKLECNVDQIKNEEDKKSVIMSSKNLRLMMNVKEKTVCFNCSKKDKCKFFEVVPIVKKEGQAATVSDLQLVLFGLYKNTLNTADTDADVRPTHFIGEEKRDVDRGNKLGHLISNSNAGAINKITKRISNKNWNSANIVIESMNETLEDLVYNNGIVLKTLINAYIETKKEEETAQLLDKEADDKIKEINNDPYVKLIRELKLCKNRKEKKILISRFNKTVGFGWGEYKKVFTEKEADLKYPNEEAQEPQKENKRNNKPFREIGSSYTNTAYISNKNINQIEKSKFERQLVTQQFSQKINMKNTKVKFLQGQQNLSLLMNQSRGEKSLLSDSNEKSYVKVPGAEYKRAIDYLEQENELEDKVKDFKDYIEDKRNEYSVDIRKSINSKLNKIDRKLEDSKKFTLKRQIENSERYSNDSKENNHKLALDAFENTLKLESGEEVDKISNSSSPLVNSSALEEYKSNKTIDIKTLPLENIQFFKQSSSSPSGTGIEFYKQQNMELKEKTEKGQKLSKIKKVIKNKHIYRAQNYYNNFNLEHLQYEKDSDVSKAIQFEKSIQKD